LKAQLKDCEITSAASWADEEIGKLKSDQVHVIIINSGAERTSSRSVSEMIDEALEHFATAPIILLSDNEDLESISQAFALGVKGYIPSSLTSLAVVAVVRLVCVGGSFAPTTALLQQPPAQDAATHTEVVSQGGNVPAVHFTQRQMEILDCLHHGLSNKLIAHRLAMSENTVKVHIRAIMKRLHATNRTQAVCLTRSIFRHLSSSFTT
jgi:DNA-binding NarL/FixJ family response regulator